MVKRASIIALTIMGTIFMLLTSSCFDRPSMDEEHVIDYLYNSLMTAASLQRINYEQVTGTLLQDNNNPSDKELLISMNFFSSLTEAYSEATKESDIGETVWMLKRPGSIHSEAPASTESLRKIARYIGKGLWSVSIGQDKELVFTVDERTKQITPQSQDAVELMQEILPITYTDNTSGYSFDYPPNWGVEKTELGITIKPPEPVAYISIYRTRQLERDESLQDVTNQFISISNKYRSDLVLSRSGKLDDGGYGFRFTWTSKSGPQTTQDYIKLHNNWIYFMEYSAISPDFEYYFPIFYFVNESFKFN